MYNVLYDHGSNVLITCVQALQLEIMLNLSSYGREWQSLGDVLYDWSFFNDTQTVYKVTSEQLQWVICHLNIKTQTLFN